MLTGGLCVNRIRGRYQMLKWSFILTATCLALVAAAPGVALAQNRTEGRCSPIVIQSMAKSIHITCPTERADLQPLEALLNTLIARSDVTQDQVGELVRLLNGFAGPSRTKLGATMTTWLASSLSDLNAARDGGNYTAFFDSSDPAMGARPGELTYYWFTAVDDWDAKIAGITCEAQPDVHLMGFKGTVHNEPHGGSGVVSLLNSSDPILQQICRGLGGPISGLGRSTARTEGSATIFDYLSKGQGQLLLKLMPIIIEGERTDGTSRNFWAAAFVAREYGSTPNLLSGPEFTAALSTLGEQATQGKAGSVTFALSAVDGPSIKPPPGETYTPQTKAEFGSELQRMDANWMESLATAAVVLHGQSIPLLQSGRSAAVLHASTAAELGSPTFWQQIRDPLDFQLQVTCFAARFAVDRGYVAVGDLPDYGRCGRPLSID